jgi:hypothetical protein
MRGIDYYWNQLEGSENWGFLVVFVEGVVYDVF